MGTQQQFCLRWNNHQSNMLSVFDDLFQNEALVDVTLACDGLSIKAHKMVLSACSPYFQSLFLDNPCKHPIVILKDIRFSDLKALMDFMYKGEVNVSQEQLSTLLKTAETLKVRGLTEVAGGGELHNSILSQPGLAQHHPQSTTQPTPQLPRSSIPSAPPLPQPTQQQPPQLQPQQQNPGSPSPKRRRARQGVHKSERSSSQSEQEDSDSHDLMEPKVEITEDNIDDDRLGEHGSSGVMRIVTGRRTGNGTSAAVANDYTTNTSQGVSSTHETNSTTEAQGFPARGGNVVNLTTPPLMFNPPAAPSTIQPLAPVQSIGQPPVLQGTSQGRERHVRKWNEATLAEAMEAVRTKRLSIIAACRQYEIPWGTLYRRLSLANIRSAYSRNDQNYSQYINMIPQLIQLQGSSGSGSGSDGKATFAVMEQDSASTTAASTATSASSTAASAASSSSLNWQSGTDRVFTFAPRKVE